jgi:hypothetical protein
VTSYQTKLIAMPGTFSQIYIQVVFAVKGRENMISKSWSTELHKYIVGIIKSKEQKPIIVNGNAGSCACLYRIKSSHVYSGSGKRYKKQTQQTL